MKPGTLLVPEELAPTVEKLLQVWRQIERQNTPYGIIPMRHNELHEVRRDFGIRSRDSSRRHEPRLLAH